MPWNLDDSRPIWPQIKEKLMKDIILEHQTGNPADLAAYILARVRQYREKEPTDDMTVLVMGLVKY